MACGKRQENSNMKNEPTTTTKKINTIMQYESPLNKLQKASIPKVSCIEIKKEQKLEQQQNTPEEEIDNQPNNEIDESTEPVEDEEELNQYEIILETKEFKAIYYKDSKTAVCVNNQGIEIGPHIEIDYADIKLKQLENTIAHINQNNEIVYPIILKNNEKTSLQIYHIGAVSDMIAISDICGIKYPIVKNKILILNTKEKLEEKYAIVQEKINIIEYKIAVEKTYASTKQ